MFEFGLPPPNTPFELAPEKGKGAGLFSNYVGIDFPRPLGTLLVGYRERLV